MAHRYSATIDSAGSVNAGAAYAEMLAGATKPISVRAVLVTTKTNIGGSFALCRAHAIGTGAASGIATATSHRTGSPVSTARAQAAWSSAPTGSLLKFRSDILPVATGESSVLWHELDGPIIVEPGNSLLLVNSASGIDGGGLRINFTWEEGPASDH